MRTKAQLLCFALWLVTIPNCLADMTVKAYLSGDRTVNGIYLNGVGQGLSWADFWMKRQGEPPMYCDQDSMPLDGNDYLKMVDRQIEQLRRVTPKSELDKTLVPALLLRALMESFPCRAGK